MRTLMLLLVVALSLHAIYLHESHPTRAINAAATAVMGVAAVLLRDEMGK